MPIDLILDAMESDARGRGAGAMESDARGRGAGPRLVAGAGRLVEWAAVRIVTAFIIGMFVTVGMALAG